MVCRSQDNIPTATMLENTTWKKNLYSNRKFPDNYTDKSFLHELKKNVHIKPVTFLEVFLGAGRVTQALSIVVLFNIVFVYLYNELVNPEVIFIYSSLGTATGYLYYRYQTPFINGYATYIRKDFRTVLIFLAFGFALSPILKTLTETISTDTIYAMTTFMMFIHLIFLDYGISAAIVSSSLSQNAAIFGSICLASRLSSPFHAFVLLTLSVECFVLLPLLMSKVGCSITSLIIMTMTTVVSLCTVSNTLTILFIFLVIFINLICPTWFLKWQSYKDNIYGPWDEAIVKDTTVL